MTPPLPGAPLPSPDRPSLIKLPPIRAQFTYRNWKGKVSVRTITVESLSLATSPGHYHYGQWVLNGECHDKKARRSFALSEILSDIVEV